jgi:signal transduction histidine kinase
VDAIGAAATTRAYSSAEDSETARLLLIDDDMQYRAVLAEILGDAGHEVIQVGSGLAGVEAAQRVHPDLVLCDVMMPGMDGYAVLAALRADSRFASTPFLFLTGMSAEHHSRAAINMGADDYLTKPVSTENLVKAVETRLARRDAGRREGDQRAEEIQRSVAFLLPHELRTPLTVILGGSDLLSALAGALSPEEITETATAIHNAAERLNRMVENYLMLVGIELARLGSADGKTQAFAGACGPDEVAVSAKQNAAKHDREADLDLALANIELPLAPPYAAKIVAELVNNAVKFSEPGKRIGVTLRAADGRLSLEVSDHGRGLSADEIAQLGAFRQFNRAAFEQQGSGLGLALVKGIVDASRGTFDLLSTPGEGTTARVSWPRGGT